MRLVDLIKVSDIFSKLDIYNRTQPLFKGTIKEIMKSGCLDNYLNNSIRNICFVVKDNEKLIWVELEYEGTFDIK